MKRLSVFLFYCFNVFAINQNQIVVVVSPPRTGTHLIVKCAEFILNQKQNRGIDVMHPPLNIEFYKIKNRFYSQHIYPLSENLNFFSQAPFKGLFMVRDPRDVLISLGFYLKWYDPRYKEFSPQEIFERLLNDNIKNLGDKPFIEGFSDYLKWSALPNFYTVRYEDLVGVQGNGSAEKQLAAVTAIAKHLEVNMQPKKIREIAQKLYGGTWTFNVGKIGNWVNYFSPSLKNLFIEKGGNELLKKLGYIDNDMW